MKRFVTQIRQISVKPFPSKQRRHALKKSASKLHISFPFVLTGIVYEGICPGIRDHQPHKQERCRLMKTNNKLTDGTNSPAWLIVQSEHTCRASFTRNDQPHGIFQASARSLSGPTWNFRQCLHKRRKQMVSAEREAMMGWTEEVGVAAWVTKWRPVAALAVSKADLRKAHVASDNNSNVWKRWAVLSWSSHVVCWSFCARRWYTSLLMMILVSSGVNECRPAHGNVTPWHYSCSVFPFCSVFISTSLLMLFQVFYLYSITTKVYSSPETAGLAPCYVFLLSLLLIPLTPPRPPLPPLCDVFQAVPEKPQWNCRQAEQSGHPWRRLQYQGHGQRQLHVQMCPHADWWWVQPDQVKSLLRYRQNTTTHKFLFGLMW